ncbi:hypothetical protein F5Y18DRAFT_323011 [Xylariaceae sp. FL1019]|nr:hypothetical protein F5Y18DRAFT_323011 [Xylariaceae sp. FL1019]
MASRAPPLLEPYVRLPHESSLVLLTSVLGSSTNWLVQRFVYSLLSSPPTSLHHTGGFDESIQSGENENVSVVLVSFLRDYAFWKDGVRRLGLDLDQATKKGSFAFIDGLTGLFTGHQRTGTANGTSTAPKVLSAGMDHFEVAIRNAVHHLQTSVPGAKTVLIVDQPDLLLAATEGATSQKLRAAILALREHIHSCIITVSADEPLIALQASTLEKEHASFALSLAHDAGLVMSLRMLETGVAKDVSGVMRVTSGGDEGTDPVEDRELLYYIGGDGGVRVFERGQ